MDDNTTKETKTLTQQAFETFDVELLKKAIKANEDINSLGSPIWADELWCFADTAVMKKWSEKRQRIKEFLFIAVQHGLDLSTSDEEDSPERKYWHFYSIVRFCCNYDLEFLQFLINLGVNLNGIVCEGTTALDELEGDIFFEEAAGHPEGAKWYYEASRLLIKNGAKSYWFLHPGHKDHLHKGNNADEINLMLSATRLDLNTLKDIRPETINRLHLAAIAIEDSKYFYPHEFYAHTKAFQQRIIDYLKLVIEKIGKDAVWKGAIEACVELQYAEVIEYLLDVGISPNINCFTPSYDFVSSSALYTLNKRGFFLPKDISARMEKMLLDKGAVLTKNEKKPVKRVEYEYNPILHAKMLGVLLRAWNDLDASELLNYIHADFRYDSQWVFDWMNTEEYSDYIVGKFNAIKKSGSQIDASTVDDPIHGGQMIALAQDNQKPAFLRIQCAEGKITKMDMCMF